MPSCSSHLPRPPHHATPLGATWQALEVAKLVGFEADAASKPGGAPSLPSSAELQSRERSVTQLIGALDQLYQQDMSAYEQLLPLVQDQVTAGGASASDAARRARSLAQAAGCEPTVSIELLCALGMSDQAEGELKVLNPLLTDAEMAKAFSDLTSMLLTISRTQVGHLPRSPHTPPIHGPDGLP